MKWFGLYKKIGKQQVSLIQKTDVVAIIDGIKIPLLLRFEEDGSPYLISKEELKYNQCRKCLNYNDGDGYDDISKCEGCKYNN